MQAWRRLCTKCLVEYLFEEALSSSWGVFPTCDSHKQILNFRLCCARSVLLNTVGDTGPPREAQHDHQHHHHHQLPCIALSLPSPPTSPPHATSSRTGGRTSALMLRLCSCQSWKEVPSEGLRLCTSQSPSCSSGKRFLFAP